ncbi:MAG: hypothetical protein M1838_000249 [Thelocarpon superellum]|nr:MAG: hypothetical protein M1838_000249 [Thelocarpon superellum]
MPSPAANADLAHMEDSIVSVEGPVGTIKAPNGRTAEPLVSFESGSLEELQQQLRQLLEGHTNEADPAFVTGTFAISADAVIRIARPVPETTENTSLLDPSLRPDQPEKATATPPFNRGRRGKTVHEDIVAGRVLTEVDTPAERTKSQRGIAKAIVAAVGQIDGFAYGVRNEWESKKDGHRFQYACQDSLQNKDRKRNTLRIRKVVKDPDAPGAGSSSMLPTYDCGGLLTIKFSTARAKIDVIYGHAAIHQTVAARRDPTRKGEKQGSKPSTPTSATTQPPMPEGPTSTPYFLPKQTPSEQQVTLVPEPMDYQPHPASLLVPTGFDATATPFGDAPPFMAQPFMPLEPPPPNPFFTANGTPLQEGVFEHRPDLTEPWKPLKTTTTPTPTPVKEKAPTTEKRKRATGIVRSRKGCTTCRQRRIKCDEGHPICINCSKSRRECSYASPDVSSAMSSPGTTQSLPSAGPESVASNPGPGDGHNWQPLPTDSEPTPEVYPAQDLSAGINVDERLMQLLNSTAVP